MSLFLCSRLNAMLLSALRSNGLGRSLYKSEIQSVITQGGLPGQHRFVTGSLNAVVLSRSARVNGFKLMNGNITLRGQVRMKLMTQGLLISMYSLVTVHCKEAPGAEDDKKKISKREHVETGILFVVLVIFEEFLKLIRWLLKPIILINKWLEGKARTWDKARELRNYCAAPSSKNSSRSSASSENEDAVPGVDSVTTVQKGMETIGSDFFETLKNMFCDMTSWWSTRVF